MTLSHSKRCTSSVGMGRRRPDLSYSPRRVLTISMALTLPSAPPTMRCGAARIDKAHAFFFGGLNLLVDGGHVFALAAIEDGGLRAHAQHGARGIDGRVAAADDGDAGTDRDFFAAGDGLKERAAPDKHSSARCRADRARIPSRFRWRGRRRRSWLASSLSGRSKPTRVLKTNLTPTPSMRSSSRRRTDLGRRYSGMAKRNMPPASLRSSKMVTSWPSMAR